MRLAVINYNNSGIAKYRILEPHILLSKMSNIKIDVGGDDILFKEKFDYDVIFVHNSIANNDLRYARIIQLKNIAKLIVDVDDYWMLPHNNILYPKFKKDKIPQKIIELLKVATIVTTTTKYLANNIIPYNKNVVVLPNGINKDEKQFQHNKQPHSRVNIGMATGSSHIEDIKLLRGYLNRLPTKEVQFCLAGFDVRLKNIETSEVNEDYENTIWRDYERILLNNYSLISNSYLNFLDQSIPHSEYVNVDDEIYRRFWTQPIQKYGMLYNWFDMVVAPLIDNKFNAMKSELKIIESGFHGLPIICSNLKMYADTIKHGETGFLVDEKKAHKDFIKYTKILLTNESLRKEMGENLRNYCLKNFELSNITQKRKDVYLKYLENGSQ